MCAYSDLYGFLRLEDLARAGRGLQPRYNYVRKFCTLTSRRVKLTPVWHPPVAFKGLCSPRNLELKHQRSLMHATIQIEL